MTDLDIGLDLFSSPELMSWFVITRAQQTVDNNGRAQAGTTITKKVFGSVQPASGRTLHMMPDLVNVSGVIDIYTKFRLEGPSDTTTADNITWQGRDYTVATVQSYTNWGAGWVHAICTLKQLTAQSPTPNFIASRGE
jgi:hypothetical protein